MSHQALHFCQQALAVFFFFFFLLKMSHKTEHSQKAHSSHFPLSRLKLFPRFFFFFAARHSCAPEWCQALPCRCPGILGSKAAPYAIPCSHYSQNLDSCSSGTHTHTHTHTYTHTHTHTCTHKSSRCTPVSQCTQKNTDSGGQMKTEATSDLNLCETSHQLSLGRCPFSPSHYSSHWFLAFAGDSDRWQQSVKEGELFHFNLWDSNIPTHLSCLCSNWSEIRWHVISEAVPATLPQLSPRGLLSLRGLD